MSDQVARLYITFDANGRPYIKGLKDIDRETTRHAQGFQLTWQKAAKVAGAAIGVAFGAQTIRQIANIGVATVKAAASLEYEMSRVKANADGTAKQLKALEGVVLDLGKETVFTAGEAAQGANELVKAGLTLADTMAALPGMLDLAAAGELGVAQAAELTANILSTFNLQAKDSAMVADVLALAANRSTTEVSLMGESFKNVGMVANQLGWSVQDVATFFALAANEGLKGAEAGTALKSALMQLMVPAGDAVDIMKEYGISLYDSSGQALETTEVIRQLEQATKGLTDAERDYVLGKIFGGYGIRAGITLIKSGVQGFEQMSESIGKTGAAQDIAATKMDNLLGSWEELTGSLETAAITIGTKALPKLREWVDELTAGVDEALESGDWSPVSETLGRVIGDAIEVGVPVMVEAAADGLVAMAKGLAAAWWESFSEAVDEYVVPQETRIGLVDVSRIARGTRLSEADSLATAQRRANEEAFRAEILQMKSAAALEKVAEATREAALETIEYEVSLARFGVTTEDVAGMVESLGKVYEAVVDPAAAWSETVKEAQEAYEASVDAMKGKSKEQKQALKEAFDPSQVNLKDYLAALQEQLADWSGFKENLAALVEAYGQEVGAQAIIAAAEQGPEAVALLAKGIEEDPATTKAILEAIGQGMQENEETLKAYIEDLFGVQGETGGDSFATGAEGAVEQSGLYYTILDQFPDSLWSAGWAASNTYMQGAQARINRGLSAPQVSRQIPIGRAEGAYVTHPEFALVGEAGPELILPLSKPDRMVELMKQAGLLTAYADGGLAGPPLVTVPSSLTKEIQNLIAELKKSLGKDGTLAESITEAFEKRSDAIGSYLSREQTRLSTWQDMGIASDVIAQHVRDDYIRIIDNAIAEAQAQLEAAKAQKLPAGEINALTENLWKLQAQAADAQRELEKLARTPLESTLAGWSEQLGQVRSLMGILSYSSGGSGSLTTVLMQNLAAVKDANLALMDAATDPKDILAYGNAAADAVSSLFEAEREAIDAGLQEQQKAIDAQRDAWEESWQARSDALDSASQAQQKALQQQLSDLRESHEDTLAELRAYYDDRLQAMEDATRAEDRALTRRKTAAELAGLYAQGGWSSSDVERIWALRQQQLDQELQWGREDARRALEDERDFQLAQLEAQQEAASAALEAQIAAYEEMVEAQRAALEAERTAQDRYFTQQSEAAEAAAQAQLDLMADRYADMLTLVYDGMNQMVGAVSSWAGAMGVAGGAGGAGGYADLDSGLTSSPATAALPASVAPTGGLWNAATGQWMTAADLSTLYQSKTEPPKPSSQDYYWNPTTGRWQSTPVGAADLAGLAALDKTVTGESYWDPIWQRWGEYFRPGGSGPRVFDEGGWLPPGITTVANWTGRPELVTPMNASIGSEITVNVNVSVQGDGTTLSEAGVRQLREGLQEDVIAAVAERQHMGLYRSRR